MVSVGTPADHVAGVKYIDKDQHVTGYLDLVINNPFIPNSLPANTDVVGHNFTSSYLGRDKGRNEIARLVKTAYNHLDGYTGCSEYDTIYLYVNGDKDSIQAVGKLRGIYANELISEQKVEAREIDDECKDYSDIRSYDKVWDLSQNDDYYKWLISPFQTQKEVVANKSATLSYKNYDNKCVDISFEDTLYDVVYKGLAK